MNNYHYRRSDIKRWLKRRWAGHHLRVYRTAEGARTLNDITLFAAVRNEELRLPYFFHHYRRLGVSQFIIIENYSEDSTLEVLEKQSETLILRTRSNFLQKEAWLDWALRRYGAGRWCIVVDADELLTYPQAEVCGLPQLCAYLDANGFNAMHTLLLDMYPDAPLHRLAYRAGEDPMNYAHCFDVKTYRKQQHRFRDCVGMDYRWVGGMRSRVFGRQETCCSKFPLFKYASPMFLRDGAHELEGARIGDVEGVLLHFKFLQDFCARTRYEAAREQHWEHAVEYKEVLRVIEDQAAVDFQCADSVCYADGEQLVRLGLMKNSSAWAKFSSERT